ncbi:MAG: HspR, transcriptional repressor of DnaK operon [uncultured Nocardioidaceae bacterium]|uniref:HspR, transcriptional repressor of DnaK operon n=1 Tax=uncultured Nocardioidaceae bacterium TaxID=253824 RepID=A0A6J4LNV1_9ACTN|nr:MAG: HspR, transcriptional repressor of DnaK operon [uncultured Nocardioidaceae bacterium]
MIAPGAPGPEVPVYVISVAAELTGLHPQTLRAYDRLGLVRPGRSGGGGRRYSWRDIELLREVAELTAAGIGLEGVRRILALENRVAALRLRVAELEEELDDRDRVPRMGRQPTRERITAPGSPQQDNLPAVRPGSPGTGAAITIWRRNIPGGPI